MVSLTKQTAFPVAGLFLGSTAAGMPGAAPARSAQAGDAEQGAAGISGSGPADQSAPFQTSLALRASDPGKPAALGRRALPAPVRNVGDGKRLRVKYQEDTAIAVHGGR